MARYEEKFVTACRNGDISTVEKLLSTEKLDVDVVGSDGKTALAQVVLGQHLSLLKVLDKYGADVNKSSRMTYHRDHLSTNLLTYEETPLVTAARVGNIQMIDALLQQGAEPNTQNECFGFQGGEHVKDRTALHFAVENGNVDATNSLLLNGASVSIADRQQELPLHIAVRCKAMNCSQQSDIVRLLCKVGSDVNAINKIACVPLYLAAFYACLDKVQLLLQFGADVNQYCERESSYGSALHIAAIKDRVPLAKLLITSGAQLSVPNATGYTPLQLNINTHCKSDIAALLIYHGAELHEVDKYGYTLMAACIRNLRIECERLAKLMVYAGYSLNRDLWLMSDAERLVWFQFLPMKSREEDPVIDEQTVSCHVPDIPIPAGRVKNLCDWLRERQQNPARLLELCRVSLRLILRRRNGCSSVAPSITLLPLPHSIKDFLLLNDVYCP